VASEVGDLQRESKIPQAEQKRLGQRALRGIMNRVSEGNLDPSARELFAVLQDLVPTMGSPAAAECMLSVLLPCAVGDPNLSILVLGCHAALVCATQLLFGAAFGAAALLQTGEWLERIIYYNEVYYIII